MLAILLYVVLIAFAGALLLWTISKYKRQGDYDTWEVGIVLSAVGVALCLLFFVITAGCQYHEALYMPLKLEALNITIVEQTEMISAEATLGQGLEGMEIKREIQQTIRDRNELLAQIELRHQSLWYLFKPQRAGL